MVRNVYHPLPLHPLTKGATVFRPQQVFPRRVHSDDSALLVMTDLRQVPAISIEPDVTIAGALERMIQREVRLLLVMEDDAVIGLVTARDIQGEKPVQYSRDHNVRREEIRVADIMTRQEALEVLWMEDVRRATVGDIVATLKQSGRQHALSAEPCDGRHDWAVRGIFSTTQIGQQLGAQLDVGEDIAQTFAQLERVLLGTG